MATTDYTEFVELAVELIEESGRAVTVRTLSGVAADITKPWKGAGAPTTLTEVTNVLAVFLPAQGTDFGRKLVDAELLKRCEQVMLVAPHPTATYEGAHVVIDGGSTWKINWMQVLKPGPVITLYCIGVSR